MHAALGSEKEEAMKFIIRTVALSVALIMIVAVVASCSNVGGEDVTTTENITQIVENEEATSREIHPEIARKSYDTEFYMSIVPDSNQIDLYWVKESKNDTMTDAVYNRQERIREYLGVEIFAKTTDGENRYVAPFKSAIQNKDDSVHMLLSHVFYGVDSFITGNYLTDYNDIPEVNLDADYWNVDFMDEISVKGHMYLGFSDFNILRTDVVAYNKDMYDLYRDAIDEDFYTMVNNYTWTLDKMISIADLVHIDQTADGKSEDDTFGLVADFEVPCASLLQSSGINIVEMDEKGAYKIACYNATNKQKASDLVDKLYDLVRSDSAFFTDDIPLPARMFVGNKGLMYLARTTTLPGFLDDGINFGVVPYPMYNEEQKSVGYRSLQWGGYICIPSYLKNPVMVGETVEMLAFFSDRVNIAYYEKLLGKQVADSIEDRAMLEMIWDSVCSDFGLTYGSSMNKTGYAFMIPTLIRETSTQNLSSFNATNEALANRGLKKFFNDVK